MLVSVLVRGDAYNKAFTNRFEPLMNRLSRANTRTKNTKSTALACCLLVAAFGSSFAYAQAKAQPTQSFAACLDGLATQARAADVSAAVVEKVLGSIKQDEKVVNLDRSQPEFTQTFAGYFERRVNEQRVTKGRKLLAEHRLLLERVQRQTGVAPRYLVAFWGLETNFGSYLGNHSVPEALATLACDQRRSKYFTAELINALKIIDSGDVPLETMKGSWAGAMGNVQFMPTTFLRYAVDGDGDGKRDLWGSTADAMASAGNFLQGIGWQREMRWGREVMLPKDFDYSLVGSDKKQTLKIFAQAGVTTAFGHRLPARDDIQAALLLPSGHQGPAFLTYKNFDVIMGWNPSQFYALSVGRLADEIGGGGTLRTKIPDGPKKLPLEQVRSMQNQLAQLGFDTGGVDGRIGPATRRALASFQAKVGLIPDGYPDTTTLTRLQGQSSNPSPKPS